jgi:hypothetical protein
MFFESALDTPALHAGFSLGALCAVAATVANGDKGDEDPSAAFVVIFQC